MNMARGPYFSIKEGRSEAFLSPPAPSGKFMGSIFDRHSEMQSKKNMDNFWKHVFHS